ncbi:ROK family protein [Nocardioides insulae]|uniref:ROK family protein n=1 Tax=Nocardioides insulae TaxID=394734 RepID=UPI000428E7A2|nr:ROK family protein [Nocardioides insulae]
MDDTSSRFGGGSVCGIGAEVNVGHVAATAVDPEGRMRGEFRKDIDLGSLPPAEAIQRLAEVVGTLLGALGGDTRVAGITVGVPGLVDADHDRVVLAPDLGWRDIRLGEALAAALLTRGHDAVPVRVDNEADLAALAELDRVRRTASGTESSTAHETDDMLVVFGVAGVGGGLIADGRLVRGHRGWAGEIGHMTVEPHGRPCTCGRVGCWQTTIGLRALLAAAADPDDPVQDPALILDELLSVLVARAGAGDSRTVTALERVGAWLATGIAPLVSALDPGRVVLGGYFAALGEWLAPVVRRELDAALLVPQAGGTHVAISELGLAAAQRGGGLAALESVPTRSHGTRPAGLAPNGGTR